MATSRKAGAGADRLKARAPAEIRNRRRRLPLKHHGARHAWALGTQRRPTERPVRRMPVLGAPVDADQGARSPFALAGREPRQDRPARRQARLVGGQGSVKCHDHIQCCSRNARLVSANGRAHDNTVLVAGFGDSGGALPGQRDPLSRRERQGCRRGSSAERRADDRQRYALDAEKRPIAGSLGGRAMIAAPTPREWAS